MTLVTSPRFASTAATGADWREITRALLESIEPLRRGDALYTIGFLYVTDLLVDDLHSMLDLIRSVTGIAHWVGSVGLGVCASGASHVDVPAASLMIGALPVESFRVFPVSDLTFSAARAVLDPWLEAQSPMLCLAHGDPMTDHDPALLLAELERLTGGFVAGGLTSSRHAHLQIADKVGAGGVGGVVFADDIQVASTVSQGCVPLGPVHTVTRAEDHVIMELDGREAFSVFTDDLKACASTRSGCDIAQERIEQAFFRDSPPPDDTIRHLFQGEIHVAFPVAGSDQADYMVRNLIGIDPDSGWIAVPYHVTEGERMMFVHRDPDTVESDLTRSLVDLRDRVTRSHGHFNPQGAIYISCVARALGACGETGEMDTIRAVIGDIPLTGFYASGEISNRRLYGYTGVLILFL